MEVSDLWEAVQPRLYASVTAGLDPAVVADFCKAAPATVACWLKGEHPAKGEKLIRLWHLLALAGNKSPELDLLKPVQHIVSELFAFDIIDAPKACEILNLTPEKPSHMYYVIRGREVLRPKYTYEQIAAEFGNELHAMKEMVREEITRVNETSEIVDLPKQVAVELVESTEMRTCESLTEVTYAGDARILLASLVSAIRPVAKALLSDQFTAEDRAYFREILTDEGLFEVTNDLNALSSERARNKR